MEHIQPMCDACIHRKSPYTCEAFPDGIPDAIIIEGKDHRKPFKGDGGIRFKPGGKNGKLASAILADYP